MQTRKNNFKDKIFNKKNNVLEIINLIKIGINPQKYIINNHLKFKTSHKYNSQIISEQKI